MYCHNTTEALSSLGFSVSVKNKQGKNIPRWREHGEQGPWEHLPSAWQAHGSVAFYSHNLVLWFTLEQSGACPGQGHWIQALQHCLQVLKGLSIKCSFTAGCCSNWGTKQSSPMMQPMIPPVCLGAGICCLPAETQQGLSQAQRQLALEQWCLQWCLQF